MKKLKRLALFILMLLIVYPTAFYLLYPLLSNEIKSILVIKLLALFCAVIIPLACRFVLKLKLIFTLTLWLIPTAFAIWISAGPYEGNQNIAYVFDLLQYQLISIVTVFALIGTNAKSALVHSN